MRKRGSTLILAGLCACALLIIAGGAVRAADAKAPVVVIQTSMGNIEVELNAEKAPKTVENFLRYVEYNFYNNTIFHRVIVGFMIQGGGITAGMQQKNTRPAIQSEAGNGLKNDRGTIAMARLPDPHSATSQFFINTANNKSLNYTDSTQAGYGYTVFGKVIKGMDVVDRIETVRTTIVDGMSDVPVTPVVIQKIYVK